DLVCRARRGPQRDRVRKVSLPLPVAAGNYPRVGPLLRFSPDARIERCLRHAQRNTAETFSRTLCLVAWFLACAFKTSRIASQISGGNQDAKMDHLLQCDRTCGYSSINFNRGFRHRMGPNRSAAPAAAL